MTSSVWMTYMAVRQMTWPASRLAKDQMWQKNRAESGAVFLLMDFLRRLDTAEPACLRWSEPASQILSLQLKLGLSFSHNSRRQIS